MRQSVATSVSICQHLNDISLYKVRTNICQYYSEYRAYISVYGTVNVVEMIGYPGTRNDPLCTQSEDKSGVGGPAMGPARFRVILRYHDHSHLNDKYSLSSLYPLSYSILLSSVAFCIKILLLCHSLRQRVRVRFLHTLHTRTFVPTSSSLS